MTNKTFYHYCSIDSFFKIIESKSIWLSNSSVMNDFEENTRIEKHFSMIDSLFENENHIELKNWIKPFYELFKPDYSLIFCLSEEKDQLSQWRGYANDGTGVSIGFNVNKLGIDKKINPKLDFFSTIIKKINITDSSIFNKTNEIMVFKKLIYDETLQKNFIEEFFEKIKNEYDKNPFDKDLIIPFCGFFLSITSNVFKNPCFDEEKEWRIIHSSKKSSNLKTELKKEIANLSELKYRVTNNKITSYKILNLSDFFNSTLIPEIILGPKCNIDEKILNDFLISNNLEKTNIIKSQSSYR